MKSKHWFSIQLWKQAEIERGDLELAELMRSVSKRLSACGSRTIWDLAQRNYLSRCQKAQSKGQDWRKISLPQVEESIEWLGRVGGEESPLAVLGLARCGRVQCPICCYSRSFLRRRLALDWAREKSWNGYYAVALTFTVPHRLSDSETPKRFAKILDRLFKSVTSLSKWVSNAKTDKCNAYHFSDPGSVGFISSLECTFGANGLHPHFHTLFFSKSLEDVEALRKWFRRDRLKVWRSSGVKMKRMPDLNEEKSFQVLLQPQEESATEKLLSYINKGLFETLSVITKESPKQEGSKTIFELSGSELRYFCSFFEATKGRRFYRAGGICREIRQIKDRDLLQNETRQEVKKQLDTLVKITQKEAYGMPGLVSEFVRKSQSELEKRAVNMTTAEVKELVSDEWKSFLMKRVEALGEALSVS